MSTGFEIIGYTKSGTQIVLTNRVVDLVILKTQDSITPSFTFTFKIDDDLQVSQDFFMLKDIEIFWTIPKSLSFKEADEFITAKLYVSDISTQSIGLLTAADTDTSQKDESTPRYLDTKIVCYLQDALIAKESISLFSEQVSTEKLLRDIVKRPKYISPPTLSTLKNVFIPSMDRLSALSYVVCTYGTYDSPVFASYDIDGFHLYALKDTQPTRLKFVYLPNPVSSRVPQDSIPIRMVQSFYSASIRSFYSPSTIPAIDYSHTTLYTSKSIKYQTNHLHEQLVGSTLFGAPQRLKHLYDELFLEGNTLMIQTDFMIDPRTLVLGTKVEFFTDETRFAHLQGVYVLTLVTYSLLLSGRPRVRIDLKLNRQE